MLIKFTKRSLLIFQPFIKQVRKMNKRNSIKARRMRSSKKDIWSLRREWVKEIEAKEKKEKKFTLEGKNAPLIMKYF